MKELTKNLRRIGRVENAAFALLFLIAIWLPLAGMVLWPDTSASAQEKRRMAPLPAAPRSWREGAAYLAGFKSYFKDNFGFRRTLIRWHAAWKVNWIGASTTPDVLVGKDGWLFYAGDGTLESDRSLQPYTPEQLARWRSMLEARREWLRRRGIGYLFVIVPEKHSIYPEHIPPAAGRVGRQSRLDQLTAYLKENSDLEILDLRPALRRAKSSQVLYLRTDTHWNTYGAFVGYQAIVGELSKSFPGMEPLTASDCEQITWQFSGGDLANMLGVGGQLKEEIADIRLRNPAYKLEGDLHAISAQPIITERAGSALPRLVMFRDSFATSVIPFLAQHFKRAVYINGYQHNFDPTWIEKERPDLVIQETAERFLALDPPAAIPPTP